MFFREAGVRGFVSLIELVYVRQVGFVCFDSSGEWGKSDGCVKSVG